tara:strand:+ start:349 stop:969 length:621 start_codon:yes stop_codon:yes gene_type:complete
VITAFLTGFFLGISLILAIGAQNAFVLRQGILGKHVFFVALFCALSDALLISIGVAGVTFFVDILVGQISNILYGISALWLSGYGIIRLASAFKSNNSFMIEARKPQSLLPTIAILSILTFANPHVYLDTMILIGSVSQQFNGANKFLFALGASTASFIFFFSLAYGSKFLSPVMQRRNSWQILDVIIAVIMFLIAVKLAYIGNWL